MTVEVLTIGHSTLPVEALIERLLRHGATAIADVRSMPQSRFNPQFNRERLATALKAAQIDYVFLGKELGARSNDESCYVDDKVQYRLLAQTELFQSGLQRVMEGAASYRIALMCAEKEPLDCHRTILVARELIRQGVAIQHILADGSLEPHGQTLERLLKQLGPRKASADLFAPAMTLDEAYDQQARRIAYDRRARRK
jgi:uncharacterized protein (DUF488 family)